MEIVNLDSYSIYIGALQDTLPGFLRQLSYSRLFAIVDENTQEHCLPVLESCLEAPLTVVEIPSGEQHKQIDTCQQIWTKLMEAQAGRDALVLNLGGGVIGDMGGFCAGTFKRGMRFIQIPTTLLSQVDASIGGKLGVDFMKVKNSIGLFQNPQAVFIDPSFLNTLPEREIYSGFAEVVKHSLIADAKIWGRLKNMRSLDNLEWEPIIVPSLLIKKRIVEQDPFEKGIRKALNFGHTIGHAVEGLALETANPLLHGEAIAIGMICEAYLSREILGLPAEQAEEVARCLLRLYKLPLLEEAHYDAYLQLMGNDKKNEGNKINFSLIHPIGTAVVNQSCDPQLILKSLDFYNQCNRA
jgi:3-dehydroquinate synthase